MIQITLYIDVTNSENIYFCHYNGAIKYFSYKVFNLQHISLKVKVVNKRARLAVENRTTVFDNWHTCVS